MGGTQTLSTYTTPKYTSTSWTEPGLCPTTLRLWIYASLWTMDLTWNYWIGSFSFHCFLRIGHWAFTIEAVITHSPKDCALGIYHWSVHRSYYGLCIEHLQIGYWKFTIEAVITHSPKSMDCALSIYRLGIEHLPLEHSPLFLSHRYRCWRSWSESWMSQESTFVCYRHIYSLSYLIDSNKLISLWLLHQLLLFTR